MPARHRSAFGALIAVVVVAFSAFAVTAAPVGGDATADRPAERSLEPVSPGGPTPALPRIDGPTFRFDPAAWGVPANGTDAPTTTRRFQDAIDAAHDGGFGRFEVPAGTYLVGVEGNSIYTGGLELPSDFEFVLDDDAVIQLATHDKWNACTIAVTEQTDVVIRGGTIRGDRDTHVFTPRAGGGTAHDEGHLICIQNESERVLVDGVTLTRATGDGILLVGQKGPGSSVKDITIRNSEFDTNRRQGISIVGGVRVLIEDNEIHHTEGTSPQFGVDVESLRYESRDITIRRNHFHHNRGGDIVNTDGRNVLIEHNRFEEGDGNRNIDGPVVFWPRADQTIRHNTFHVRTGSVNGKVGIIGYSSRTIQPRSNSSTVWITDNHCDGCGFYIYNTSGFRVMRNTFQNGYIAVRDVDDLLLVDNEVSYPTGCWPYRFLRVKGHAEGNTHNGEPKPLPMVWNRPWNGCWVR
ncbi:MAG: right-handed parallel beta-helix repeat-containing protein [Actinomycetota bacterium]